MWPQVTTSGESVLMKAFEEVDNAEKGIIRLIYLVIFQICKVLQKSRRGGGKNVNQGIWNPLRGHCVRHGKA